MNHDDLKKEDEYDEIEEKLVQEAEEEERKEEMPVDGKSVFDIQKIKNQKSKDK